jgi:hypothetical protein
MNAAVFPHVDVDGALDKLRTSALRVKAERDEFEAALRDIRMGADMMLQPALGVHGAMLGYIKEVRRVADEALRMAK